MKYTKICPICGTSFKTNKSFKIYCDNDHYLPCPICGKPVLKTDKDFSRSPKCCSSKCTHELRKKHFKPRKCVLCGDWFIPTSGINTVCDKVHYKNCEICGKPFEYSLAKNGDQTVCSHECAIERQRRNSMKKYGTEHPMQSSIVQKHHKESMMKLYGVEFPLQKKEFVDKQQKTVRETNMREHGVPYACMLPQCAEAQGRILSKTNLEFLNNLRDHSIDATYEKRLGDYCYDICIESQKLLVEIDPTYTHNSIYNHYGQIRDKYYHRNKTICANDNGYQCIHIFDWDDKLKILNMLYDKISIDASELEIYKLKSEVGNEFLNNYHLRKSCYNQLLYLGLVKNNELYQIMTFGKSRYNNHFDVEMLRTCTRFGYDIIGGAAKLFSFALNYFEFDSVISYCDIAKSNQNFYTCELNMKLHHIVPPSRIWSKNTQYITDKLLVEKGCKNLLHLDTYNSSLSNDQIMVQQGWFPVYDCGQAVYTYTS